MTHKYAEGCSCGASFGTDSIAQLKIWRKEHHAYHPVEKEGTTSQVELKEQFDFDDNNYTAKIGFTPNEK